MAVLCSHCGEELMGAVNRCWKCGKPIVSHSGPLDVPPVRRDPIVGPLNAPLEAMVLDEPTVTVPDSSGIRRGSPFAKGVAPLRVVGNQKPERDTPALASVARTIGPESVGSQFASVVAVGLAFIAWGVSFRIPVASVCLALCVIFLGIWGLFGSRRGVAILALLLGCTALGWGAFGTLVQIYQMMYGVHPFAT